MLGTPCKTNSIAIRSQFDRNFCPLMPANVRKTVALLLRASLVESLPINDKTRSGGGFWGDGRNWTRTNDPYDVNVVL